MTAADRAAVMMKKALSRAREGQGTTHPNPSVGAVIYRGDVVLGSGRTQRGGRPHAEVMAIRSAIRRHGKSSVRGASMAVTLEPCCFTGKSPPCTEAVLAAGIRRVYVGMQDPHPRVRGRGTRKLRAAGLKVEVGILEQACREHHRGFVSVCQRSRPFVTLKLATTLDARIATRTGESRWITGPEARRFVHGLRERVDGIMIGSGTALADDPDLSARRRDRVIRRPDRVLVDSKLRVPAESRVYASHTDSQVWVLTSKSSRGRAPLERRGAGLIDVPGRAGALDLRAGLAALADAGLTSLLVEGGGRLAAALLRADVVDELHWITAPTLLGGDAVPALGDLAIAGLGSAISLDVVRIRPLGRDTHVHARISVRPTQRARSTIGAGR